MNEALLGIDTQGNLRAKRPDRSGSIASAQLLAQKLQEIAVGHSQYCPADGEEDGERDHVIPRGHYEFDPEEFKYQLQEAGVDTSELTDEDWVLIEDVAQGEARDLDPKELIPMFTLFDEILCEFDDEGLNNPTSEDVLKRAMEKLGEPRGECEFMLPDIESLLDYRGNS